jgi:hypothetical protein
MPSSSRTALRIVVCPLLLTVDLVILIVSLPYLNFCKESSQQSPAGLACAGDLVKAGIDVAVHEALHVGSG